MLRIIACSSKVSRATCLALIIGLSVSLTCQTVRAGADRNPPPEPQARRAIELKDYYRIESIGSPAISHDGKLVAFVRTYVLEAENRRLSEIWLAPSDGSSAPKRITDPASSATNPRWSPDDKLLAFTTARRRAAATDGEDSSPIWFLNMNEPAAPPLQIQGVGGSPIFSPDNHWIAFTKRTLSGAKTPKQYASDFERQTNERFKGRIIDWMDYRFDQRGYLPDPRDPVATPPEELYVVPRAGGTAKQITHLGVNVQAAAWRPDGICSSCPGASARCSAPGNRPVPAIRTTPAFPNAISPRLSPS
jgi:dipeptidyl aminopeptidase/acylaminoacyl peptidase